jgi:hypothetical protein
VSRFVLIYLHGNFQTPSIEISISETASRFFFFARFGDVQEFEAENS